MLCMLVCFGKCNAWSEPWPPISSCETIVSGCAKGISAFMFVFERPFDRSPLLLLREGVRAFVQQELRSQERWLNTHGWRVFVCVHRDKMQPSRKYFRYTLVFGGPGSVVQVCPIAGGVGCAKAGNMKKILYGLLEFCQKKKLKKTQRSPRETPKRVDTKNGFSFVQT